MNKHSSELFTAQRYFIEYDDRRTGWHTMEGPSHTDAKVVAQEVAETLDQFGRFGVQRAAGISAIRVTYVSEAPVDVTQEIAEAILQAEPRMHILDALAPYVMEGA